MKQTIEYYVVEYYLQDQKKYACYFNMESAQEAMMKMIRCGVKVAGMESKKL
jgi:hypothetical protein